MIIFWLALSSFAVGTESLVIAGLLPVISGDLHISLAATGQLVTIYALTYAIGSPILAVVFNNVDRRTAMIIALSCFIAGNLVAVAAGGFGMLLASRMLMALGAGLSVPTGLAVAVALAAPERRGRAVALVGTGITVATVLGVPLGTLVGNHFGWRATFAMVAMLGVAALAGLLFGLPHGLPRATATLKQRLAVARHGAVLHALVTTVFWSTGAFTVFTYLTIPMHQLQFSPNDVSIALLVFGLAAAIGNMLGGGLADRIGAIRTTALSLAVLAIVLSLQSMTLKYAPAGDARYIFVGLLFCWALAGWTFYPAQVSHLVRLEPHAPMIVLSLNASAMYLGTAIGGALGGVVVVTLKGSDLGWVGGCSMAIALLLVLTRGRMRRVELGEIAG
jgi:predicted MFS family arabinose efflux permease